MALFLGLVCGIVGSVIVILNSKLAKCRKLYITRNSLRVFEAVFFAFITTTAFYWLPHVILECKPMIGDDDYIDHKHYHLLVRGLCKKGEYSSMASLLYNTEADAIKAIMSGWVAPHGITMSTVHMSFYLLIWFIFTVLTYGVWVPAGTFLPAIIIGCAIGSIY